MTAHWLIELLLIALLQAAPPAQQYQRGPAQSPHGSLQISCGNCHTSTSWSPVRALPEFNHNTETRFALRGSHQNVPCRLCHVSLTFRNVGSNCSSCHADIHRREFGSQCESCHTVQGWRVQVQAIRAHQNRFPLLGAHSTAACESCHPGAATARFTGRSTECISCHRSEYDSAKTVDHRAAGFPVDCTQCHGMDNWTQARFDHNTFTSFPLDGAHTTIECRNCHTGSSFRSATADCASCHNSAFVSARPVDHVRAGFPRTCAICHSTSSWAGARFDHGSVTSFQLTGAHQQASCLSCHVNGVYAGTRKDCYSCHSANFASTTNPDHSRSGFPLTCERCHNSETWAGGQYDHTLSRFQLTGAHVQVACAQCHAGGRYTGTPLVCSGCHLEAYQRTTNPNHTAAGFPQDCLACHTTAAWAGAAFDHDTRTRFALTGAHVQATCLQCHTAGKYAGTPQECAGCHLSSFQQATDPNHVAAGFPQTCLTCHTTAAWGPSAFNHSTTRFALTGAHAGVSCTGCHTAGRYAGTPLVCAGCHLEAYQKTTNPNHVAAGFPQDCSVCHSTTKFTGATFNHSATRFPLTGRHTGTSCAACHTGGVYAGLSLECVSCHLPAYQGTTNPNHATSGFPQQCSVCHTTLGWSPANFNHSTTAFPLTGRHTSVSCASCHIGGRYSGTPSDCHSCHSAVYRSVTDPNHVAAGFPTSCQTCHTTSTWSGATFDHTWFPIYSGAHRGRWTSCQDCHTNSSNFQVFSCLNCHAHEKARMDEKHRERPGYVYNSANCYSCHPTGKGD